MPAVQGFLPSTNGFHFSNGTWSHIPLKTIDVGIATISLGDASNGLCGGMAYAVRDYFEAGRKKPSTTQTNPPPNDPLYDYIVNRLIDSFDLPTGPSRYYYLMNPSLPDHETFASTHGLAPHGRAWIMVKDEWPKIQSDIDNGKLSPLGLIGIKSSDPTNLKHNHQVLVYGYTLNGSDLTLNIYDPNYPDDDKMTMELDIAHPTQTTFISYIAPVYCFFRTKYSFVNPPA